jgi:hypothetical protein
MLEGEKVAQFCLVSQKRVPVCDLLLTQKFLLECDPQQVWDTANRWVWENSQWKFVYSAPQVPRLAA